MKNILLLFGLALLLLSCEKDKGILRPGAKVSITGVHTANKAKSPQPASAPDGIMGTDITDSLEFISKYVESFNFMSLDGQIEWGASSFGDFKENYDNHHDTINFKLFYQGGYVIDMYGNLGFFIVDCKDACFYADKDRNGKVIHPLDIHGSHPDFLKYRDTVAYIPNAVLNKARAEITAAFNREDFTECYRLFDEAFVFVPITGEKWRALKAAGIE